MRALLGRRVGIVLLLVIAAWPVDAAAQDDPWFGRDKLLHGAAGAALGVGGYFGAGLVFDGRGTRVAVGLSLGIGAGAAKELRDRRGHGTASWRDLAWTAGGATAGVTTAWLIDRARRPVHGAPRRFLPPGAMPSAEPQIAQGSPGRAG